MSAEVERLMRQIREFGAIVYNEGFAAGCGNNFESAKFLVAAEDASTELRAALLAVAPQWRDISEAPRDGTRVLLYHPGYKNAFYENRDRKPRTWVDWCVDGSWYQTAPSAPPTHYQPLPTPPAPGGEGE